MIPRSRTREPEAVENQAKRCSPSRGRDRPDLTEPLRRLPTEMTETHSSSAAPPLDPSSAVTVMDVAREAGVSVSTVSRIVNGTARVADDKRLAVEAAINTSFERSDRLCAGNRPSINRVRHRIRPGENPTNVASRPEDRRLRPQAGGAFPHRQKNDVAAQIC